MKSDHNPLSKPQVALLGALASEAFAFQDKHDLLDLPAEVASDTKTNRAKFWRQRVRAEVTGHTELSDCRQLHFRKLKGKLLELARRRGLRNEPARRAGRRIHHARRGRAAARDVAHRRQGWIRRELHQGHD